MACWLVFIPSCVTGENGTIHYQGYAEFFDQLTSKQIHKMNGWSRTALFMKKGTQQQAIDYCKKEDTRLEMWEEFGEKAPNGIKTNKQTSLTWVVQDIQKGTTIKEIANLHGETFVKHHSGLTALSSIMAPERTEKSIGWIFYGEPNTGKSYMANSMFPNSYHLAESSGNSYWFDGYDQGQNIIIDDFYGWLPMSFLLKFVDAYSQRLPIKGGFVQNTAQNIIFLSNCGPEQWYKKHFEKIPDHKKAMLRRFEQIWEFVGTTHKDRRIIKHKNEDERVSRSKSKIIEEDPTNMIPLRDAENKLDELNVGGGLQCEHCLEDYRHCQGQCLQQLTPTQVQPLTILQAINMTQNKEDFKSKYQLEREEHDMGCNEDIDHMFREINMGQQKAGDKVWGLHPADDNRHIGYNMQRMDNSTFAL